jgi:hypothetical protein
MSPTDSKCECLQRITYYGQIREKDDLPIPRGEQKATQQTNGEGLVWDRASYA